MDPNDGTRFAMCEPRITVAATAVAQAVGAERGAATACDSVLRVLSQHRTPSANDS